MRVDLNSYWIIVFALSLALSGAACNSSPSDASEGTGESSPPTEHVAPPTPIEVLDVATSDFAEAFRVLGTAEPSETVRVSTEAPGLVLEAPFEEGGQVRKGALLYRIDAENDDARINLLKSQISTAERELDRAQRLANEGLGTPQQLDQAESALENAQLQLRQAQVGKGKAIVRSPITGYVTRKMVESGEYAAPGNPLAEIVVYDKIIIRAMIPESDMRYVNRGDSLEVEIPALEATRSGTVRHLGIIASNTTRTYPVEIEIANDDFEILPGMRARVLVPRKQWEGVIMIPREAVLEGFNQREAMVVTKEANKMGQAELRVLELGPGHQGMVIVTRGLEPGDRLITRGHRSLVPGSRVEIIHEREPDAPASAPAAAPAAAPDPGPVSETN